MDQWYRLPLGDGASKFQTLREVRECRAVHDQGKGPESVYPVLVDVEIVKLWLYLPPGNDKVAMRLKALPCLAPEQDADRMRRVGEEYHPTYPPHPIVTDRAFSNT